MTKCVNSQEGERRGLDGSGLGLEAVGKFRRKLRRGFGQSLQEVPVLFAGGGQDTAQGGAGGCAQGRAKAARNLLTQFHHAKILFRPVSSEGHGQIRQETQGRCPVGVQAQSQIVTRTPYAAAGAASRHGSVGQCPGCRHSAAAGAGPPFTRVFSERESVEAAGAVGLPRV